MNAGGHSHNDCGSFMVWVGGEPQIVDAGNMTYTGKTFSAERYTLWNTRSMYHSVPMIGGFEQVNGWTRRARDVEALPDGLGLDMAPAYPEGAGVAECRRRATCSASGCRIEDLIRLEEARPVTEVFLLRNRPMIEGGDVCAGRIRIAPDRPMEVGIEEIPVTDTRMARKLSRKPVAGAFTTREA